MRKVFLFLSLSFAFSLLQAQPDENYIKKLTGVINMDWMASVGKSIPVQQLNWLGRKAPGFNSYAASDRKQMLFSSPWSFCNVDTFGVISNATETRLPHSFETNRNYRSGWYFIKFKLEKGFDKSYALRLNRIQMFSLVYVNGQRCGHHFGGYTPFEMNITDVLVEGENVLSIFVYDQSASVDGNKAYNQLGTTRLGSIYNPTAAKELPGGIEDVPILQVKAKTSIKDIFVKTSTRKGEMEIAYELNLKTALSADAKLSFELYKWPDGEKIDLPMPTILLNKTSIENSSCMAKWSNPKLWSPDHPELYVLRCILQNGQSKDVLDTRFGFREFWIEGKSFMLNGLPIRLRGESFYAPVMKGRDFHREAFRVHKKLFGSNACRLHAFMPHGDVVLGADEAGILLDDQSAIWSENAGYYRNGGEWFLKNTEKEFEEWVRRDRNSPSVVIWDVENEMLRISFDLHLPWVSKLPGFVKKFDTTRPINNSGAGWYSPNQEMVLLHMQEHYTKITSDWIEKGTNPLINGEFWVGGRAEERLPNSPELASAAQRFEEEGRIYEEKLLEMRYLGVSGVMPFRISGVAFRQRRNADGYHFSPPYKLEIETRSEEGIQRIRHGLQPVTVFLWPRQYYASSDNTLKREIVVCNDGETSNSFDVSWKWENQTSERKTIFLQPSAQERIQINLKPPANTSRIIVDVSMKNMVLSSDTMLIVPISLPPLQSSKPILVFKDENLAKILTNNGIKSISSIKIPSVGDHVVWVIPEHSDTRELVVLKDKILNYVNDGGNMLCLKQDQSPTWMPVKFQFWSANQTSPHNYAMMGWEGLNKNLFFSTEATIFANSHPIFAGLNNPSLHSWDKFDGRVSDDVFARPGIINKYEPGNWRPLAGGTRREHISLAEIGYGKGTIISCQLNVIDNLANLQAKTVLVNMLNYLSAKRPETLNHKIEVRGILKSEDLEALTGVSKLAFFGASAQNHDLMIATEGADVSAVKEWATKGGKVIVFSGVVSQTFAGIGFRSNKEKLYYASKVSDHHLLYGVSTANFLDVSYPLISGYFSSIPDKSHVLLQGFANDRDKFQPNLTDLWTIEDAGPVMVTIPYGAGEILVSTIEITNRTSASARELLCLLLTNGGVEVPYAPARTEEISIKKTIPVVIDGVLKDWTEDMEDRLVTKFIHAQPVYLTSENIVKGPPEFDLNLSAINYFLWNEQALYFSGVVFSEEKTFEAGVRLGSKKEYELNLRYNKDVFNISFRDSVAKILVNGKTDGKLMIKTGQVSSKNLTDASTLQFNYILKSGKIATVENLVGKTFEVMIPWKLLNSKPTDETSKVLITIESKGSKLQVPFTATVGSEDSWLHMRIVNNLKK